MFPTGIDLVVAGPPCQPFSYAGRHRGLEDPRSKALLNVARLIHYLHHSHPRGVSYVIDNVPGTDKHPEVQRMLGVPVWLDAPPCGSGAHKETLFWQNLATVQHVQDAFTALPTPTLSINDRLSDAGMSSWRSQPRFSHPPNSQSEANTTAYLLTLPSRSLRATRAPTRSESSVACRDRACSTTMTPSLNRTLGSESSSSASIHTISKPQSFLRISAATS